MDDTIKGLLVKHSTDIKFTVFLLLLASFLAVAVGFFLDPNKLGDWGSWLSAFIAGIAMLTGTYAVILQAKQAEALSWNMALDRLSQLYDQSVGPESYKKEMQAVLLEIPTRKKLSKEAAIKRWQELNDSTKIWLINLLMAFEQIFIATEHLSEESKRVWRFYLENQMRKESFQAMLQQNLEMNENDSYPIDFHRDFWALCEKTLNGLQDVSSVCPE